MQDVLPLVIEKEEVSSSFSQVLEDLQVAVGGCQVEGCALLGIGSCSCIIFFVQIKSGIGNWVYIIFFCSDET